MTLIISLLIFDCVTLEMAPHTAATLKNSKMFHISAAFVRKAKQLFNSVWRINFPSVMRVSPEAILFWNCYASMRQWFKSCLTGFFPITSMNFLTRTVDINIIMGNSNRKLLHSLFFVRRKIWRICGVSKTYFPYMCNQRVNCKIFCLQIADKCCESNSEKNVALFFSQSECHNNCLSFYAGSASSLHTDAGWTRTNTSWQQAILRGLNY